MAREHTGAEVLHQDFHRSGGSSQGFVFRFAACLHVLMHRHTNIILVPDESRILYITQSRTTYSQAEMSLHKPCWPQWVLRVSTSGESRGVPWSFHGC